MRHLRGLFAALLIFGIAATEPAPSDAAPEGQVTWAVHISLAPTWFDPAETAGIGTPFMVLYALHDAMVKPMPGNAMAPSLAESWSLSKDGLVYEFVLRQGAKFHNGEPVTADDVKFSFERYRGAASKAMKDRVAAVEVADAHRVRFRLKEPWPDFMTYYGSLATGAGWIVPRKYVQQVGDDGFKKLPVGAGPYRFVSFTPGVELVLEAHEQYWRKVPSVKRLVFKSVADEATRLAMLKRGEADIVYLLQGELAEEVRRTPGAHAQADPHRVHALARVRRSVGPEVAVGGQARPPRREPCDGPPGRQRGADPGILEDQLEHHPPELRFLLAAAPVRL